MTFFMSRPSCIQRQRPVVTDRKKANPFWKDAFKEYKEFDDGIDVGTPK